MFRPNVRAVILQIGGNDLALGVQPISLADDIVNYVDHLHHDLGVPHIFVSQLLPRFSTDGTGKLRGRRNQPDETRMLESVYHKNMQHVNHYLEVRLDRPYSHFRKLHRVKSAPSYLYSDGTHLSDGMVDRQYIPERDGMKRYQREIRGIALKSVHV